MAPWARVEEVGGCVRWSRSSSSSGLYQHSKSDWTGNRSHLRSHHDLDHLHPEKLCLDAAPWVQILDVSVVAF